MIARIFPVLVTTLLFGAPAAAQEQIDRRSRDEPEIVVEAGGRVGPCDVLRFAPDGRFLLAGGDDKVVRVWPHSARGLDTERAHVQTLRWRAWREQRGGIKTLAVSADGKRVAVGGYGMKPSTVAILDHVSGDTVALSWPKTRRGDPNFGTVTAVCFDDAGRVGFGTADGSLWLWEPVKLKEPDKDGRVSQAPVRVGKFEVLKDPDGNAEFNFPRLVHFRDKNTLIGVAHSGQVMACDLTGRVPDATLFNVNDGLAVGSRVYRAELIDGGRWFLVACADPHVLLRSADGKRTVRLPLERDQFPRSVAWHPEMRQLAIGVGRALGTDMEARFYSDGSEEIWLYDDPIKNPDAPPKKLAHVGRAEALAFHPTEPHLAVAGGDADEIMLLSLARPEKPLTVVRGAGRRPAAVNISANGKTVGVQIQRDPKSTDPNARGTGAWTRFDLSRLKPTLDESQEWVNPIKDADGWVIEPGKDRFIWYAKRVRDGLTLRLGLDRHRDLAPTCFTFLPAKGDKPTRVLVGHYYGCTLFELVPTRAVRGTVTGAKIFTGHAGEVTSVVADREQKWFLTGGTDHTVAAWSLADWPKEPNLGATFAEKGGAPVVTAVDVGSPAWEAGLRVGDVLDLLAVDNKLVFDRRPGEETFGTADAALAELRSPRPRVELYFGLAATEQADRWKWFPAFDTQNRMNDWVVWMWHGSYYHTKTANGDRLVGWHVNALAPGDRPEFYQLQQFEKRFHQPDVIETLTGALDVGAALVKARGPDPVAVSFTKFEPDPVRLALGRLDVPAAGLPLTIAVSSRGNDPDLRPVRVELWLNDHRLEEWPKPKEKLDPTKPLAVTVAADKFRAGENRLTALVLNAGGGRVEDARTVRNDRAPADAHLLTLLAGVNDYSDHRKNAAGARAFGDLKSARADATALGDQLAAFAGPKLLYTRAQRDVRLDGEAARKKLSGALAALADRARPDDLLVVFFAGHGDLLMPNDGPLPKEGRAALKTEGTFYFCCPDYTPARPGATALSAEELFAALARINCRKVVLIDACHSGRATTPNLLRRCVPNGQGPVVMASCDQSELSYEDPGAGHGLFTDAVLDALDPDRGFRKADYDTDGQLSPEELFEHVAAKVPVLMKQLGKTDVTQTPICFPPQLPKYAILKR
ncbi:MAG: caspase family protein [Planctomycetes bacterium]|nr:caspase family protein [Planctomycetota bacterium]